MLLLPQQSTPFGHTVSSVHKVGSHSIYTPISVHKMPEVFESLSKCSSPSMTPGPSQLNKQCSHLAVAEKVGSHVHTPADGFVCTKVPTDPSSILKYSPTSIHKLLGVQVSLSALHRQ